jgi:hypothetical protein
VRFVSGACLGIQKSFYFLSCAHFAWFCTFLCSAHSNVCAFWKWGLPGHPKKVFVFLFVHILHGFAHFGPFCTPISVPFDFVSGACLRIQ